jgi:hypothetical protein
MEDGRRMIDDTMGNWQLTTGKGHYDPHEVEKQGNWQFVFLAIINLKRKSKIANFNNATGRLKSAIDIRILTIDTISRIEQVETT